MSQNQTRVILAIEDDANIGAFLREAILQETSYQLVLVEDGLQALQLAPKIKPHLFIMNYRLPHFNGIELYDRLHAIKELEHVPAIMVSAVLPEQEVKQRSIIGMKKPFELSKLLDAIEQLMDKSSL